MVPKEVQKFVELRFKLAKDKIETAHLLCKEGKYRDAVSRAYYAMFYAAKAVILLKNYKYRDPKTHKGVKTLLSKYFIQTKEIEQTFGKMFSTVERARTDADYKETVKITKEDARKAVELTEKFVKKMNEVAGAYLSQK